MVMVIKDSKYFFKILTYLPFRFIPDLIIIFSITKTVCGMLLGKKIIIINGRCKTMEDYLALFLLLFLGSITLYIFVVRVIIPIYKIYHDQMQIK